MSIKKPVRFIVFILLLIVAFYACNNLIPLGKTANGKEVFKVVIDPGHGGKDPGATGASGLYEKDFTLSLAEKVGELLEMESQIKVYMTREDDTFLSAKERFRPKFANKIDADLFISIHGNTYADPSISGTQSFYYHINSKPLAKSIHQNIVNTTGFIDRGVERENYFVLKDTNMPAVLLEIGYLTNPEEEQKMLSGEFQELVAAAIRDGVKGYLEIE